MKISIKRIKPYFVAFLLIFSTDSFLTFANINTLPRNIFLLICTACGVYWIIKNKGVINLNKTWSFIAFFILIMFTIIVNNDYSGGNFIKLYIMWLGLLISGNINFKELKRAFISIMEVISIVSLGSYVLYPLLRNLTFLPIISNGQKSVLCLGLTNLDLSPDGILRNWGPFWEPGVFQIYLNIEIFFLLLEKEKDYKKIILNAIAIITTFSTTGFISLILIVVGFYLNSIKKISLKQIIIGIFGILICFSLFLNETFSELLFGKFNVNNIAYASTSSRLGSIVANWLCVKHNPLCGVGVKKLNEIVESYRISKGYYFFSNTNGLLMNYAIFGCVFGILYTILIILFVYKLTGNKKILFIFVLLAVMIELFSEPLVNSLFFNTIIFYSFNMYKECINENS